MTSSPGTIAQALHGSSVDMVTLQRRYGAQFAMVRKVLGVAPNAAAYLEIWPIGMRTYNVLVPNFLNLPFLLFGFGPPKATVGLAMYTASRAAGCAYCASHCCAFALRRGADEGDLVRIVGRGPASGGYSSAERSALDVAEGLGRVPGSLTPAQRDALRDSFSPADAEWLVLAVAVMGFLNKFNDTVGIPLEESMLALADEVIGPTGWTAGKHLPIPAATVTPTKPQPDRFVDLLGLLPVLPSVIRADKHWTSGVPHSWPAVGIHLRQRTGHDFPILAHLSHGRAIRALAAVLGANTDPKQSRLGLRAKHLAGLVYANAVEDEALAKSARNLAEYAGATTSQLAGSRAGLDVHTDTALAYAEAASSSPAQITPEVVAAATKELAPPEIIELTVWISVMQLLHRLHAFYE
ncbi:carboxymuconolactone decarboxylase family protein [Rhodococcus aetherivorans]|uniref:carboxymuconolactone decarboxylase family protein n=1 Tax=Rhodococcus aetherivorans TaxID=191292 RepID=UPI0012DCAB39|nr:carboxymuconolactone decarboxylase family protein [Rhodococcus aetherivorans]